MINIKKFCFIFFLLSMQTMYAQSDFKLIGKVLDNDTKKPIEFAAVAIKSISDSSVITGGITDESGKFSITLYEEGSYIVESNFVGYSIADKVVNVSGNSTNAGEIFMTVSAANLDDVVITADKTFFQNSIDKKVYNLEKDIVGSSGTATEALANIPSVTVDIDGNVALRGNSNVTIFIDGKPSGLMGSSMVAILDQIPASSIESIEVITNPSARYDAEGSAGILNIVLKKNKQLGLNGNVILGVNTYPGYDASATLNYRNKKWNLFGTYSYMNSNRDGESSVYRETFYEDTSFYLDQTGNNENKNLTNSLRGGFDYYINDNNTFSLSGYFGTHNSDGSDLTHYDFKDFEQVLSSMSDRTNTSSGENINYNAVMNYKKIFSGPQHTLSVEGYFSNGNGTDLNNYYEQITDPANLPIGLPIQQNINYDDNDQNINAQADYVQPFDNGNKFETGVKYTRRYNDNDQFAENFDNVINDWVENDSISNRFIYDENVLAAYGIWNSSFDKFGYQIGLRAEQTYVFTELVTTDENFKNDYFKVFPSLHMRYQFSEGSELYGSYSRRMNRPRSWFLNPFPDYSDPYSYRVGNPFLLPENEDSYELGFLQTWQKHSLSAAIYFKDTKDEISSFTQVDTSGVSVTTFVNYDYEKEYGIELVSRDEFTQWFSMTSSINMGQVFVSAASTQEGLTNSQMNYNIRLMPSFKITKQTSFQVTFSYWTPWAMAQGDMKPFVFMDAGIRSDFFQNRLTLNLSATDIFNTREFSGNSYGTNFNQEFYRKRNSQALTLKATYKFGQQDSKRKSGGRTDMDNGDGGGYEGF
ncbi:MAG: TonB-dependent receptor [Chitinophagales bacterium]|nr:TonB-dependent receptor [Chitinophagales bacterium]MBP8752711.1 TonB-dependent receptor [Chitinophagales bacterium]MBP9189450.1 TonB-dependent receptor [Chitinophagales bacterium]MBP9704245.1 TonB-dependent receptor [Chitinophagales bacterium]